eukprot:2755710-Prymnesium_polylepis.2
MAAPAVAAGRSAAPLPPCPPPVLLGLCVMGGVALPTPWSMFLAAPLLARAQPGAAESVAVISFLGAGNSAGNSSLCRQIGAARSTPQSATPQCAAARRSGEARALGRHRAVPLCDDTCGRAASNHPRGVGSHRRRRAVAKQVSTPAALAPYRSPPATRHPSASHRGDPPSSMMTPCVARFAALDRRLDGTDHAASIVPPSSAGHHTFLMESISDGVYCFPLQVREARPSTPTMHVGGDVPFGVRHP